ncbi:MAG: MoaD/ThiS family protein [Desulfovibrionaceae bacterium]
MRIELKCFASLACYAPKEGFLTIPDDATVATVIDMLTIAPEEVKIIFINGVHGEPASSLHNGDRLGLIPAVGGG